MFVIVKNGKYVLDFTDGEKFTRDLSKAEQYMNEKSAKVVASEYGRKNGSGYHVRKI